MAYEARRGNDERTEKEQEEKRNIENNTKNIRNAADVAIASGEPHAAAVGTAVKALDKATGGKTTEAAGKALNQVNKMAPGGARIQNLSNKASESGLSDTVGRAASMKNGMSSGAVEKANGTGLPTTNTSIPNNGGGQGSSLPSSSGATPKEKRNSTIERESLLDNRKKNSSADDNEEDSDTKSKGMTSFFAKNTIVAITIIAAPFLIIIMLLVMIGGMVTGLFSEYEDAFGMSQTLGEETGGLHFTAATEEQQAFYDRVNNVKLTFQAQGKTLDAMKIVAIYHVLNREGADITYKDATESVITEWASAMFEDNSYSEETFRENLINQILPKYFKDASKERKEELADQIFKYIEDYYNLIGVNKNTSSASCASIGNCEYDIKGFYLGSRGNVVKNMQIKDLKVRLMECGAPYGNGTYTKAIDQDLVNFEDYVAGVAYAEVGPSANEEVLKAQMVAARSYALARPTAMGNSAGKKLEEENGQWILQISSCVADQVFCNIDEGCSFMGGGDGQGGICRSGKVPGAVRTRDALPEDHPLRKAAAETQGEVLVNAQGYIISTGFLSSDQNAWASLAKTGLNYKQILLQHYNQGSRDYKAADIVKASCNSDGSSSCTSNGEFASWKQGDGQWGSIQMGTSGKTIHQIGCLVTSVSMLIAKSGVETTIDPFNPGTFVNYLNTHGGITSSGNYVWASPSGIAPRFVYQNMVSLRGMSKADKLNKIKEITSQNGVYAVAEVKGNTGQHWVAIDSVTNNTINMMDPASDSTDMWAQYNWENTSTIAYYKVG